MSSRNVQDFTQDFIDSFNNFLDKGPSSLIKYIRPFVFDVLENKTMKIKIVRMEIGKPIWPDNTALMPWVCRRMVRSYDAKVEMLLNVTCDGEPNETVRVNCGTIPIMLRSKKCHLAGQNAQQLVSSTEEPDELGGYFIVGGHQYILRYLISARRHFPLVLMKKKEERNCRFTGHICTMKCVRSDEVIGELKLRWMLRGYPIISIQIQGKVFTIPIIIVLKALTGKSSLDIVRDIHGVGHNSDTIKNMMVYMDKNQRMNSQETCLSYIGKHFRDHIPGTHRSMSDLVVGQMFLDDYIAIHVQSNMGKYGVLMHMYAKLYSFFVGQCCEESTDTLDFQELLTSGSLYQQVLRTAIMEYFQKAIVKFKKEFQSTKRLTVHQMIHKIFRDHGMFRAMHTLMSQGIITAGKIIPGIKQNKALSVRLDNINFVRFLANFRSTHRGNFFATSRNAAVRKLTPETWGFVCPVHTPDGMLCGILNHLAFEASVQGFTYDDDQLDKVKEALNIFYFRMSERVDVKNTLGLLPVMVDGVMMGFISSKDADSVERVIRTKKVRKEIPETTEIALIKKTDVVSQYPGIYIFTSSGRFLRSVKFNSEDKSELIGSMEQNYINIYNEERKMRRDEKKYWTHSEWKNGNCLSLTASFTPYLNFNPSPRNIYQCQMLKQSMGHFYYQEKYRGDKKLYCFRNPQIPLVRTKTYDDFHMDNHPIGFNATVAVCSYTGYDMEDAITINRSSLEYNMSNCCIIKNFTVDLTEDRSSRADELVLGTGQKEVEGLPKDGLPWVGMPLSAKIDNHKGSPLYCSYNVQTEQIKVVNYEEDQPGWVTAVSEYGEWHHRQHATITVRINRPTIIGDKFATRHGQKGVNSLQRHVSEMPRSWDGVTPDIMFNPHGFPSRMTVGMLIEFLAGKVAAIQGSSIDGSSFQPLANITEYGEKLEQNFYHADGTELFIDGERGKIMHSHVTMGVMYYQRLRHLVQDKYQVRNRGHVYAETRQPLHGRKRGGGVRLGEMERDGLLSHGAAFTLQDRLVTSNSDSVSYVLCNRCHSFVTTEFVGLREYDEPDEFGNYMNIEDDPYAGPYNCRLCGRGNETDYKCIQLSVSTKTLFDRIAQFMLVPNITVEGGDDDDNEDLDLDNDENVDKQEENMDVDGDDQ